MTTPKEALELKPCPFCGATPHRGLGKVYHDQLHGEPHQDFSIWCPKGHAKITGVNAALAADEWNTRATASLQGEDAVERVARIIDPYAWTDLDDMTPTERFIREKRLPKMREEARTKARAILATGLVPDEAAIRADNTANLISIIVDIREKTGLGGKPMLNELADAIVAEMDRRVADEQEKCASEAFTAIISTLITDDGNSTYADHIAAAIRSGGGK